MKACLSALAALAAMVASGCASSPGATYAPARTRATVGATAGGAQLTVETRQFIPASFASEEIRVACRARTFEDEIVDGIALPTLRIRIWIYNYSRRSLELRPAEFYVLDDLGARMPPPRVEQDGQVRSVVLATAPVRTAVDLVFRLPEGYDPAGPRSLRLFWGFRIDDREYRHETLFEPGDDASFRDPFAAIAPRSS